MSETCPITGLRCVPGVCSNNDALERILSPRDLVAAMLRQTAKNLGVEGKDNIDKFVLNHPDYTLAANEAQEASTNVPGDQCTPLHSEICLS